MSNQVLIVGGGAAGLMAGIAAGRKGIPVTILESMEKPGKKLLLTGNGRCNLTYETPRYSYHGTEDDVLTQKIVSSVMAHFSHEDTLEFFSSIGLALTTRNEGIYPASGQSAGVLELLLAECRKWNVKLKFREKAVKIRKKNDGFEVFTEGWHYEAGALILACGSKALPVTGSDGSGYELAGQTGHSVSEVVPALTALNIKDEAFKGCAGIRLRAKVTLCTGKSESNLIEQGSDVGELQFTDRGISGIVVFQISRFASLALNRKEKAYAVLTFMPEWTDEELLAFLQKTADHHRKLEVIRCFGGLLPEKLLEVLLKKAGINKNQKSETLQSEDFEKLVPLIRHLKLEIKSVRGFDNCQVCAGGVSLKEIQPESLESRIHPRLYFAGELLNVDGPCGGYNLQWAWSSGFTAGEAAAQRILGQTHQ